MDPETLVTFLFKAPPQHRVVELLGSWDNFSQPYQMHHDRRRGAGFWSGCFRFENIIFDGDSAHWIKPRSGGLKQGGVYWYYYRLDYDIEAFDDSQSCNAHCPLMPGQMMNVIEVPTEVLELPSRSHSMCYDGIAGTLGGTAFRTVQTMEPGDRTAALEPPPISKVHGRCISDLALNGRLEHSPSKSEARVSLGSPLPSSPPRGDETEALNDRPSKRRCSGDRPRSAGSWKSEPPQTRSSQFGSVMDAYTVDSPSDDPHPDPLRSLPVDEDTRASWKGLAAFDFGLDESSVVGVNNDEREQCEEEEEEEEEEVGSVYGPASVRNVQMYGSPPSDARNKDREWRPALHSLPDEGLLGYRAAEATGFAAAADGLAESLDLQAKLSAESFEAADVDARSLGREDEQVAWRPRSHSSSSPFGVEDMPSATSPVPGISLIPTLDPDDLCSPTFSAATASSNDGLNTPFRLSVNYSRDATGDPHGSEPLDDITQRLHLLGASSTAASAQSSPTNLQGATVPQPTFTEYALPQPAMMESVQSLGKLSASPHEGGGLQVAGGLSVSGLMLQPSGSSMVDDLFTELGYLGASIT